MPLTDNIEDYDEDYDEDDYFILYHHFIQPISNLPKLKELVMVV